MFAVQQKDVTLTRRARQLRHSARTQVVGLSLIGTERRHLDKTSKRYRCSARINTQVFAQALQAPTQVFVASPSFTFPLQKSGGFPIPFEKSGALQQSDTLFRSVGVDAIQPSFAYAFARMRARVHLSSARLYPPKPAYSPHTEHTQVRSWA